MREVWEGVVVGGAGVVRGACRGILGAIGRMRGCVVAVGCCEMLRGMSDVEGDERC
jgi:hypothetical protein